VRERGLEEGKRRGRRSNFFGSPCAYKRTTHRYAEHLVGVSGIGDFSRHGALFGDREFRSVNGSVVERTGLLGFGMSSSCSTLVL
jgi:hypothetical protein